MKTSASLLFLAVFFNVTFSLSQHPLVGTWEMISVKGIDSDGQPFYRDTTSIHEIKVITATHYILIAHDIEDDSLIFNRSYAGTIELDGDKYLETPQLSSLPIFDNVKQDFRWKREGDRFIQSGSFTRPDGKTIVLEELVFRLVKDVQSFPENPSIGTWEQLSSTYTLNGKTTSHTNATATRFHIITPTHWMRLSHRDNKFENAMGGRYELREGKVYTSVDYSSFDRSPFTNIVSTEVVKGNKLYVSGTADHTSGEVFTWRDEFERAE